MLKTRFKGPPTERTCWTVGDRRIHVNKPEPPAATPFIASVSKSQGLGSIASGEENAFFWGAVYGFKTHPITLYGFFAKDHGMIAMSTLGSSMV